MKKLKISHLYKCLADLQRMRILRLLADGALCVCHLQTVLDESQVKISKQLQYLRNLGLVEARRNGKWMFYSLTHPVHPVLQVNLDALSSFSEEYVLFLEDARKRSVLSENRQDTVTQCADVMPEPAVADTSEPQNPIPIPLP